MTELKRNAFVTAIMALALMALVGCQSSRQVSPGLAAAIDSAVEIGESYLEAGKVYVGNVDRWPGDQWRVVRPPIPCRYGVSFEWLNLSNFNGGKKGRWVFVVTDIERYRLDQPDTSDGFATEYHATYRCRILRIEKSGTGDAQ